MPNPFTHYPKPKTAREAQSNVNFWCFEGMLTTEEIEDLGHIPASYRTYIKVMSNDAKRELRNIKGSL
jgi:hypothetical protein